MTAPADLWPNLGLTCRTCGTTLTEDNTGCAICDRCEADMPGSCHECRDLAREDAADRARRAVKEAT